MSGRVNHQRSAQQDGGKNAKRQDVDARQNLLRACGHESGDDGGWSAYAPDLPGLGVSGDSLDEVRELIRKAIAFHVAGLRDGGLPVPKPSAKAGEFIEISTA